MEEETTPSPEYIKGFNEGYVMAKEAPELAQKISNAKGNTERLLGLQDGFKEYSHEKLREMRPKRMTDISKTSKNADRSKNKDKDIERD